MPSTPSAGARGRDPDVRQRALCRQDRVRRPRAAARRAPPPEAFADPPFVKDPAAYARNALAPPNSCAVRLLGQYRDLAIAQIQCMVGQYNPVTDELRLFDAVEVLIDFRGGRGAFITTRTLGPFEKGSRALVHTVISAEAVRRFVEPLDLSIVRCFGEELLVLTHPDFRPAADTLAQWKRDKGIATTVIEVGAGTPLPTAAFASYFQCCGTSVAQAGRDMRSFIETSELLREPGAGEVSLNAALGELVMWHAYGDPTLEMWTRNPYRLTLPGEFTVELLPELLRVQYAVEGAEITALQETPNGALRAIGRGMVRNGAAELMLLFGPPDPGAPILLSASLEDAISLLLTPRSSPVPDVR